MIHLFIAPDQIADSIAHISGPDHLHLARVLRARPGQAIVLLDNRGNAFQAILTAIGKSETLARIDAPLTLPPEPSVQITVGQALGKGDKFEQVIQHGTEVGAACFIPLKTDRSVVEVPAGRVAERVARWRQIAKGAAEQSHRMTIPYVTEPQSLSRLLDGLPGGTTVLLLHPSSTAQSLASALRERDPWQPPARLVLAIGPEGGWSEAELALSGADESAVKSILVTIGPRVLRTETAALVAISQILYHVEQSGFGDQSCVY